MYALFNLFLQVCLLRCPPQDMPASAGLLKATLLAYAATGLVLSLIFAEDNEPLIQALLLTLLSFGLLVGLSTLTLQLLGFAARLRQTLIALAGTGTLLQLIGTPLALWLVREREQLAVNEAALLPNLAWLGLVVWSIIIMGYILQHALSSSRLVGVLWALAYTLIAEMVYYQLLLAAS